ncbi:thiopeptide-type bacteriocin biosynthesis protein [Thermomonospora cellulosilytica]|uniref:Thiopeptide-type bacteriocin biosynthesis protein n=1 Tax=Thermomonospora cellulosilytica TaxID=1411118 RepID=A0A7W3R7V4_9ACTN|nr:thiopeptide-type bacteriocin biosynthesis protein [Thermomonospora cellulosilytica]MBA9003062.1 thiopeptide-type bacteriocin biosynthesis protein [Thermomonospora cellulosilytica]
MPDDQLTRPQGSRTEGQAAANIAPHETADGVLAVLAGVPVVHAAARIGMQPADLADAVEVYRAAGYAALHAQATDRTWYQARIQFTDWGTAEHIAAAHLAPRLSALQEARLVVSWWFIRKAPSWRLRVLPAPAASADMKAAVSTILDGLAAEGLIARWRETIYEPESAAFGGPAAMELAHALFHADSRGILDYALRPTAPSGSTIGRRELSILLCSALLRGAKQDWYEQGDVWHRVARLRPLAPDTPTQRLPELARDLRLLMTADTRPTGPLFGPNRPLAFASSWITAFDVAGRALEEAAGNASLERGLRDVLAHHVIFHWNRLGLPASTQSILARAARDTILDQPLPSPGSHSADGR